MYNNDLFADDSVKNRHLQDLPEFGAGAELADDEEFIARVVFYDTAGLDMFERTDEDAVGIRGDSKYNENEAEIVGAHIKKLCMFKVCPQTLTKAYKTMIDAQLPLAYMKAVSPSYLRIKRKWYILANSLNLIIQRLRSAPWTGFREGCVSVTLQACES